MLPKGDSKVNRRLNLGHAASSDRRTCLATRIIDFCNIYSRFYHNLLSATGTEAAVSMLFGLLVARAVYALHAIIEDFIELLYCLLLYALVFTEVGFRDMFLSNHMVEFATISYFYLNSRYIESALVFFGVHKGIFIIDVHEIHINVLVDPVFTLLVIS
jgi:hypothetical protein